MPFAGEYPIESHAIDFERLRVGANPAKANRPLLACFRRCGVQHGLTVNTEGLLVNLKVYGEHKNIVRAAQVAT